MVLIWFAVDSLIFSQAYVCAKGEPSLQACTEPRWPLLDCPVGGSASTLARDASVGTRWRGASHRASGAEEEIGEREINA
jgi:hypothetical protein